MFTLHSQRYELRKILAVWVHYANEYAKEKEEKNTTTLAIYRGTLLVTTGDYLKTISLSTIVLNSRDRPKKQ